MAFGIVVPYLDTLLALPGGQITAFAVLLVLLALVVDISLGIVLRMLGFLVGKTKTTLDDRLLKASWRYIHTIAIVTSLWISLEAVYPGMVVLEGYSEFDLYVIAMLLIAGFLLSTVIDVVLLWYGIEIRVDKKKVREEEVFPFVRNVVKVAVILVFAVFILHRLGFETGALVTGLGVGGLAVALALQDTLGNFFAGVHILVDRPFREEDYVRVDPSGPNPVDGTVKQIGWRTTKIETFSKNMVVVPNMKLAGSMLENFSSPDELTGVIYEVGVDFKEDVDEVERIILDALRQVAAEEPLLNGESAWARFESFGDFALSFKFGYQVKGYVNRFLVHKKVAKGLFYSFRKNNVRIPFPVRVQYPPPKLEEPGVSHPKKK